MSPETAAMLRAIAATASHAQASPTDSAGIRARKQAQGRAEAAWVAAGSPDLPAEEPRPLSGTFTCRREAPAHAFVGSDDPKDWTREEVAVEVLTVTDRAFRFTDGGRAFWCPRSVVGVVDGQEQPENVGDFVIVTVPRWAMEKAA